MANCDIKNIIHYCPTKIYGPVLVIFLTIGGLYYFNNDIGRNRFEKISVDVIERTWSATQSILAYVIPFAIYPAIIFYSKKMLADKVTDKETKPHQIDDQAKVITWVIKVLIMVFVFFALIEKLEINVNDDVQIVSIFSLGLSWSMRDWLSSLWACFMLAFTTRLSNECVLKWQDKVYTVEDTGLMFVKCKTSNETCYIPNNSLLTGGFVIIDSQS